MDNASNFKRGFTPASNPKRGQKGAYFIYVKGALYRIWCGVNRPGDSGVKVV